MPLSPTRFCSLRITVAWPDGIATLPPGTLSNPRMNGTNHFDVDVNYNTGLSIPWVPWVFHCKLFGTEYDFPDGTIRVPGTLETPTGPMDVIAAVAPPVE